MVNRREVIASGLGVSLLAGTGAAGAAAAGLIGEGSARTLPGVAMFIAEERIAAARHAARAAASKGASVRLVGEDVTALYEWLALQWRGTPFPVAGLTSPTTLFVLERLAWDHGLRTPYRGEHRRVCGQLEHRLPSSPALLARLESARERWAEALGNSLVEGPSTNFAPSKTCASFALLGCSGDTLTSWLLAPSRKPRLARRRGEISDAQHGEAGWPFYPRT